MHFNLEHSIALLERTPATLNALLHGLPENWTHHNEGNGTWTVFDILGHLVHGEHTDWMQRLDIILKAGDSQPFPRFDREAMFRESQGKSVDQLLREFSDIRAANLTQLREHNLQPTDLERRGQHPALGPVTLGHLLATWGVHDLTHLHQISRVMAHQHREAVGPWAAYLGVLTCQGHGA